MVHIYKHDDGPLDCIRTWFDLMMCYNWCKLLSLLLDWIESYLRMVANCRNM
jgi:hypothetical protein